MTEYQNLLAQKAALEAQIATAQAEAKADAINKVRELIREHDLTPEDLQGQAKPKGSVGAPKYRDPATGATWTGRGKPPNWIREKDRAEFLIPEKKAGA